MSAIVKLPITAAATATPAAGGEVRAALFRSYGANLPPQLDVSADVLSTFPGAVPALGSWTSPIQPALAGYTHVAFGCVPSQNSRFELLKFLDTGGVLSAGTATANGAVATAFVLDHDSTTAFTGWAIRAVNSGVTAMTMANFTAVLSK
jgi:hypothetical protein